MLLTAVVVVSVSALLAAKIVKERQQQVVPAKARKK